MAKYNVTYKCGHAERIELYGTEKERQNKIAYYQTRICPDCYKAQQAAKSAEMGLPELEGTEKQVAWAFKIRAERYPEIKRDAEEAEIRLAEGKEKFEKHFAEAAAKFGEEAARKGYEEGKARLEAIVALAAEAEANLSSAKWWIEHR